MIDRELTIAFLEAFAEENKQFATVTHEYFSHNTRGEIAEEYTVHMPGSRIVFNTPMELSKWLIKTTRILKKY